LALRIISTPRLIAETAMGGNKVFSIVHCKHFPHHEWRIGDHWPQFLNNGSAPTQSEVSQTQQNTKIFILIQRTLIVTAFIVHFPALSKFKTRATLP